MSKRQIILIVLSTCITRVFSQHELNYNDFHFRFRIEIDSTLSTDSVNFNCSVKSIKISGLKKNSFTQTIIPPENSFLCGFDSSELFKIEDVNFDSTNDIRLLQFLPASANFNYYYWIFSKSNQKFERNDQLEKVISPHFDKKHQLIISEWSDGCCDHGKSTYIYKENRLLLVAESRTTQDKSGLKYITTLRKLVNGKMVIVKKTIEK